jgi:hypothetical protein
MHGINKVVDLRKMRVPKEIKILKIYALNKMVMICRIRVLFELVYYVVLDTGAKEMTEVRRTQGLESEKWPFRTPQRKLRT